MLLKVNNNETTFMKTNKVCEFLPVYNALKNEVDVSSALSVWKKKYLHFFKQYFESKCDKFIMLESLKMLQYLINKTNDIRPNQDNLLMIIEEIEKKKLIRSKNALKKG